MDEADADLGTLLLAPIASDDAAEVDGIVLGLLEKFSSTEPTRGADAAFRSIVAVFHRLNPETDAAFIVATHTRLKPAFLDRGLMLGEFYPTCPKPGLRNPDFRPLRSPVPLLVIRQMAPDVELSSIETNSWRRTASSRGQAGTSRASRPETCSGLARTHSRPCRPRGGTDSIPPSRRPEPATERAAKLTFLNR